MSFYDATSCEPNEPLTMTTTTTTTVKKEAFCATLHTLNHSLTHTGREWKRLSIILRVHCFAVGWIIIGIWIFPSPSAFSALFRLHNCNCKWSCTPKLCENLCHCTVASSILIIFSLIYVVLFCSNSNVVTPTSHRRRRRRRRRRRQQPFIYLFSNLYGQFYPFCRCVHRTRAVMHGLGLGL